MVAFSPQRNVKSRSYNSVVIVNKGKGDLEEKKNCSWSDADLRVADQLPENHLYPAAFTVLFPSRALRVIQARVKLALLDTREDSVDQQQGSWAQYQRQPKQTWWL